MVKVKTAEAAQQLGVSTDFLINCIHSRVLKEGTHFTNISKGKKRPTYRWDVQAIENYFNRLARN